MKEWVFSGIGTAILSGLASLFCGIFIGYKIGIRSNNKQIQSAGDNSVQNQHYYSEFDNVDGSYKTTVKNQNTQTQEAGHNSVQRQTNRSIYGAK